MDFQLRLQKVKASIDKSLDRLQTDHIDLMLLHQPFCDWYSAYRALEKVYKEGKLRAIGVSNFYPDHFIYITNNMEIVPAVNQVETHVFNQQTEPQKSSARASCRGDRSPRAVTVSSRILAEIGSKYGKSIVQIALRWLIQRGVIIIPKSIHIERMQQNTDISNFELTDKDMATIATLDMGYSLFFDHYDARTTHMFME